MLGCEGDNEWPVNGTSTTSAWGDVSHLSSTTVSEAGIAAPETFHLVTNVSVGSIATERSRLQHVRFPPKATKPRTSREVRKVPNPDIGGYRLGSKKQAVN